MKRSDEWVDGLFRSIDARDVDTFCTFLSDRVLFRFGNAEPVLGKAAVRETVAGFFDSIRDVCHELAESWHEEQAVICHGTVTYTRHDGSTLRVPFANVFKVDAGLVAEYLIFVDVSRLYETG